MRIHHKNKCKVVMTKEGPKIEGTCAGQLDKLKEGLFSESKKINREISSQACINPKTGNLSKVVMDTIGDQNSTFLRNRRVCSRDHIQLSMHTHPSGITKFSEADAQTSINRINNNIDDGHCVIGEDTLCIVKFNSKKN